MALYFGSPDQQAMARRAAQLWTFVRDDPRLNWYGRVVGLNRPDPELGLFEDLVRLQGVSVMQHVPRPEVPAIVERIEGRGLKSDILGNATSTRDSVTLARAVLANTALPADLEVCRLDAESPEEDISGFAEVALENGVLPPPEEVLRGIARRGCFLLARERDGGRAVATGAAVECYHPASDLARSCNWGMLATRPDRRGEKIGLVLGAQAILEIYSECGFIHFRTGIRDDNAASLALSAKLGVGESGTMIIVGTDPESFSSTRMTR